MCNLRLFTNSQLAITLFLQSWLLFLPRTNHLTSCGKCKNHFNGFQKRWCWPLQHFLATVTNVPGQKLRNHNLRTLQIGEKDTDHFDYFRVHGFGEHAAGGCDVVDELVEACAFDLLALEVGHWVHEVEHHAALLQLLDEQILLFWRRCIWKYDVKDVPVSRIVRPTNHNPSHHTHNVVPQNDFLCARHLPRTIRLGRLNELHLQVSAEKKRAERDSWKQKFQRCFENAFRMGFCWAQHAEDILHPQAGRKNRHTFCYATFCHANEALDTFYVIAMAWHRQKPIEQCVFTWSSTIRFVPMIQCDVTDPENLVNLTKRFSRKMAKWKSSEALGSWLKRQKRDVFSKIKDWASPPPPWAKISTSTRKEKQIQRFSQRTLTLTCIINCWVSDSRTVASLQQQTNELLHQSWPSFYLISTSSFIFPSASVTSSLAEQIYPFTAPLGVLWQSWIKEPLMSVVVWLFAGTMWGKDQ